MKAILRVSPESCLQEGSRAWMRTTSTGTRSGWYCRSKTSPQHVCWGDSGHVAVCNTGQNAAVLKELLLSRLDSHIWKIIPDLPSRATLASPSPLGLCVVLRVLGAEHELSTLAPSASPTPVPSAGSSYTLPSVLILHGVRSTGNTKEERLLGFGNKYTCPTPRNNR